MKFYSSHPMPESLAAAIAVPLLGLLPAAQAASTAVQLPSVTVEGEYSSYQPESAQSPKFTAPLADTPRTVQVIPERLIQDQGASDLEAVLRNAPGISMTAGEGGRPASDLPFIRGQNSASSLFVDGLRDPSTQSRDTFNLEQVDVVKGPDSVFSGRGGAGGSINLVTKTPRNQDFTEVQAGIGTAETYRGTIDGNWVLGENTALRLNLLGTRGTVPGRDKAVEFSRVGIAPSLRLGLSGPTRVTLGLYHYRHRRVPDYSIPYDPRPGTPITETIGVSRRNFYGLVRRDSGDTEDYAATVKWEHDLANGFKVENLARYSRATVEQITTMPELKTADLAKGLVYRNLRASYQVNDSFANRTDLRGTFDTGQWRHTFDLGGEFATSRRSRDRYKQEIPDAASPCSPVTDGNNPALCASLRAPDPHVDFPGTVRRNHNPARYHTDILSLYGFDTIAFDEQWQLNLGLRWDHYKTSGRNLPVRGAKPPVYERAARTDNLFNYQLGLVYKPRPDGSVYASYGTASTPSAVSDYAPADSISGTSQQLKPERSEAIEIGTKWQVLDRRLLVTGAMFRETRKNTSIEVAEGLRAPAGKSRVTGMELGVAGSLTPRWDVYGGYALLDSKLVRASHKSGAQGQPLPSAPRHAFSIWSTYKLLPELTVGAGAFYRSKVYGNADAGYNKDGTPKARWVPAYWRFDAMAAYQLNKHLTAQLNVYNLLDKTYYAKTYRSHYAALGPGRSAMLTFKLSY